MSHDQRHRTHGIFHANPKPAMPRSGFIAAIFGQNRIPAFVLPMVLFLGLVAVVWYAYPRSAEQEIVPVIHADPMAYKQKPENPGGMVVAHQDSKVFEPFETVVDEKPEQLLPATEKPIIRAKLFKTRPERKPDFKPMLNLDLQLEQSDAAVETLIAREETIPVEDLKDKLRHPDKLSQKPPSVKASEKMAAKPVKVPEPPKKVVVAEETVPKDDVADVIARLGVETPKAEPKKADKVVLSHKVTSAPKAAAGGAWLIQLGAFSSSASVDRAWNAAKKKHGTLLSGIDSRPMTVNVKGKTLYRLRAGGFASKAAAQRVCDAIKKSGGSCIVVK